MALDAHAVLIVPGSAYSMGGPNTGQEADLRRPRDYPVEAVCCICHQVVRREKPAPAQVDWMHTGRRAGDTGTVTP